MFWALEAAVLLSVSVTQPLASPAAHMAKVQIKTGATHSAPALPSKQIMRATPQSLNQLPTHNSEAQKQLGDYPHPGEDTRSC